MGKTTLAVDLICKYILPHVRRCIAVCPTFWQQDTLKRLRQVRGAFTRTSVYSRADDSVFDKIFNVLNKKPAPTLLFIDDCAAEAATNKGNKGSFSRLCLAAPHLNLTIIGCFQRITAASPAFRDNCEGLISFITSSTLDTKVLYTEFNPQPGRKDNNEDVCNALSKVWDEHRFCFIWREAYTGKIHYYAGFDGEIHWDTKCSDKNEVTSPTRPQLSLSQT